MMKTPAKPYAKVSFTAHGDCSAHENPSPPPGPQVDANLKFESGSLLTPQKAAGWLNDAFPSHEQSGLQQSQYRSDLPVPLSPWEEAVWAADMTRTTRHDTGDLMSFVLFFVLRLKKTWMELVPSALSIFVMSSFFLVRQTMKLSLVAEFAEGPSGKDVGLIAAGGRRAKSKSQMSTFRLVHFRAGKDTRYYSGLLLAVRGVWEAGGWSQLAE
jgi:hypothetical protein